MQDESQNLYKEVDIRANKIKTLKAEGVIPYVSKFDTTHTLKEARELPMGTKVSIAGRMTFRRAFGKFMFIQLSDIYAKIQVSLSVNEIPEDQYKFFKDFVDIADFVGITGELYTTQTGEITVKTYEFKLLSKAMLPLPEKFHGLTDIETRYRQRYLDLIMNENTRNVFLGRSTVSYTHLIG